MDISSDTVNINSSEPKLSCVKKTWKVIKDNLLLILLVSAIGIGIGVGAGVRSANLDKREQMYFAFPGDMLMRMLKALIIPLIVSSLISGLAGLDTKASGKVGLYTILYYLLTTVLAVLLGITMVTTIKPGSRTEVETDGSADTQNVADSFLDLIRNMLPDNLVEACFRQTKTHQIPYDVEVNETVLVNCTDGELPETEDGFCTYIDTTNKTLYDFEIRKEDGMNILGLVVWSIAMGIAIGRMGKMGEFLHQFFYVFAEGTMQLVTVVIWYSPIGILFLVAAEIVKMEDPMKELEALGLYLATVISGLLIHGLIILPLVYLVTTRKNPIIYIYNSLQALLTALGTASSAATLPVTFRCLEEKNGIDPRVTRFVLPVGATINMDGTALYEAVAAVFIAQTVGMNLSAGDIVAICITATLASIGAASVPQAGLVTMIVVITAIGLPADEVTKVLAVDWLVDRFRTMINVEGDSIGAGVVAHLARNDLLPDSEDIKEDVSSLYDLQTGNTNTGKLLPPEYTEKVGATNRAFNMEHHQNYYTVDSTAL